MAGPYTRLVDGQSADTGAQAIVTVVNDVEAGLEAVEAALPGKETAGAAAAAQATAIQRANHTGTQAAATISDFNTAVRTNRLDQMAAPTSAVPMSGQKITGLGAPTASTDAVTKAYADGLTVGGGSASNVVNALANGIVCDAKEVSIQTTNGSAVVTATSAIFTNTATDGGKALHIAGAGAGGGWLRATISTVSSSTSATISLTASVSGTFPTAFGTNNTAAINTMFSTHGANRVYFFPYNGSLFYLTDGGHTVPSNSVILGEYSQTTLWTTSQTASMFTYTSIWPSMRDIRLMNMAGSTYGFSGAIPTAIRPTAGAGIYQNSPDGSWIGSWHHRVAVVGFYNNFQSDRGTGMTLVECTGWGAMYANALFRNQSDPDDGTWRVFGGTFGADPWLMGGSVFGILWHGGGAFVVRDAHFNKNLYGICCWQLIDAGKSYSTNLRLQDNSFEDYLTSTGFANPVGASAISALGDGSGIKWYTADPWVYTHAVNISGNIVNSVVTGNYPIHIVQASDGNGPKTAAIYGNTTNTGASPLVGLTGGGSVGNVKIYGNMTYNGSQSSVAGATIGI
jgi:hypothetical protein